MKFHHAPLAAVCILLLTAACSNETSGPITPLPGEDFSKVDARLLRANNTFAFNLFRVTHGSDVDNNLFISPLSISMALGMTMNGARGETRTAMEQTLALQGLTADEINQNYRFVIDLLPALDPNVDIAVANSIWSRLGFPVRPEFLEVNETYFDAAARELDFNAPDAAGIINSWVKEHTRGKIESIVKDPIPSYVVMYLINAIYFKAAWTITFDEDDTAPMMFRPFHAPQEQVDMMHRLDSIPYFQTQNFNAVDLRYGNGAYAMTLIIPREEGQEAFDNVVESLSQEQWSAMTAGFSEVKVQLGLPKFTHEYEKKLNDILKDLGMEIAFTPGGADFSGISDEGGLFISEVRHKSFIEVNEKGTEAAAVTSVEIGRTSVDPDLHPMLLDRPFIYVIRERETGTILFMGTYQLPE